MTAHRYLFTLTDGGGTVPPELGAAARLVDRGHTVVVLAEDSMAADVAASGAAFRPWQSAPNRPDRLPEHDPSRDWECSNPLRLFARLLDTQFVGPAPGYAADTTAAITELRPDLVVCSQFAFGAMAAAEAAGVPFDVLMPNIYLLPRAGRTPTGSGSRPAHGPLGRARDGLVFRVMQRVWDKGLDGFNDVRTALGLPPMRHFMDQADHARRQLVLTSAAFDFPGPLPASARYVGPVLDDPAWAGAAWTAPTGEDPLVLVAMSSTFQDHAATLQRIVDGLSRLPVRVVVTTGPAIDPASIDAPTNVTVVRSAPHTAVLAQAAAVVTHGGHGTVIKALVAGVPLVVVPHGRDQADNAARVARRRAGLSVARTAAAAKITTAVQRVLDDPSYAAAANELGTTIRRDAERSTLVAELESLDAPVNLASAACATAE